MTEGKERGGNMFSAFERETGKVDHERPRALSTDHGGFFPEEDEAAPTGAFEAVHESTRVARVLGELTVHNRMELHLYLQRTLTSGSEAVVSCRDMVYSVREEGDEVVARDPDGRDLLRAKDAAHMIIAMLNSRA